MFPLERSGSETHLNVPHGEPFSRMEVIPGTHIEFTLELPPELQATMTELHRDDEAKLVVWKLSVSEAIPPHRDERRFKAYHVQGTLVNPLDLASHVVWLTVKQRDKKPSLLTVATFHQEDQIVIDRHDRRLRKKRREQKIKHGQRKGLLYSYVDDMRSYSSPRIRSLQIRFGPYDYTHYPGNTSVTIEIK